MAAGWRKFTDNSPYPVLASNATASDFAYGVKEDRHYRLNWLQGRDLEAERIVVEKICAELSIQPPPTPRVGKWLKDGVILCNLLNKLAPGCLRMPVNQRRSEFACMENIRNFLNSAEHLGFEEHQLFGVSDLVDEKNMGRVMECLGTVIQEIQSRVTVKIYY